MKKKQLTKPSITASDGTKTYNGSKQTVKVTNYPSDTVPATTTVAYPKDPLSATVTAKRDGNNYTPAFTVTQTEKTDATLELGMRDAAEYTVTVKIEDKVNYEWKDGTQSDATATATVKPKQLAFTYKTDYVDTSGTANDQMLSWKASDSFGATFTVTGFYAGTDADFPNADDVTIKLKLNKQDNTTVAEIAGTYDSGTGEYEVGLDSSAFPNSKYAVGTYPITFIFAENKKDNGNYTFADALQAWNNKGLVISASGAGLDSYKFQYVTKKGDAAGTVTQSATDLPAGNKLKYVYDSDNSTGYVYEIVVDETGFADAHIAIDTSRNADGFTNGYKNAKASNAGTYTTTVALKTVGDGYVFTNEDNTTSTTKEITVTWEIEKGDIDLSQVKWQYTTTQGNIPSSPKNYPVQWNVTTKAWEYLDADGNVAASDAGLPWYGEQYTLSITGFPTGVTINNPANAYNGTNKKKFVGSYTTECVGISYDTANYNALPGDVLKLNWQIVKAKIEITSTSWSTQQEAGRQRE